MSILSDKTGRSPLIDLISRGMKTVWACLAIHSRPMACMDRIWPVGQLNPYCKVAPAMTPGLMLVGRPGLLVHRDLEFTSELYKMCRAPLVEDFRGAAPLTRGIVRTTT